MPIRRTIAIAPAVGALAFLLRLWQQKTGFDAETGLPLPGSFPAAALVALLLAAAVFFAWALRRCRFTKKPFEALFALHDKRLAKTAAVTGAMAMMLSGALEIFQGFAVQRDILSLAAGVFLVVAGGCLFATVKALSAMAEAEGVYLLSAVCCAVVQLIASYRLYAVDPVLTGYYVELLALVFHVLSFYALCGLYFSGRGLRRFLFFSLMAVILSLASLADGHGLSEMLMLLGMSAAEAGFALAVGERCRGKREQ